ncbi:site-2 protease family protein [Patescibacteria group bacterium]|nr:site-2 protease family protein [Patescibacteria group bacterium]
MDVIFAIIIGILILLFLIFIHEFGHFVTAKFFKIKVEEFGFGFPPRLWGKKKGETIYSINWIPAGGFVRLLGEDGDSEDPRSFTKKSPWIRATVVSSGVVINFLFAVLLFYFILGFNSFQFDFDQTTVKNDFIFGNQQNFTLVAQVSDGSPAEAGGFRVGDKVLSAEGERVETVQDLQEVVSANLNNEISFSLQNFEEEEIRVVQVTPEINPENDKTQIGVGLAGDFTTISYESGIDKTFSGFEHAINSLQFQAVAIGSLIGQSVEEGTAEPLADNVAGPVGIVALIADFVGIGGIAAFGALVSLMALISLILAVVNILPIPALDGGRFFFIFLEGITGKRVNPKVERIIHGVAFIVLIFLVIAVAFNDILNIIS